MPRTLLVPTALLVTLLACDADGPREANDAPQPAPAPAPAAGDPRPATERATPGADIAAELRAALDELVSGSRPREPDAHSWFSAETADVVVSVAVDSLGHATVSFRDLRPLIPNASSSAGSTLLLDELNAAVFGVAGVESVEYRMDGSCDVFWEWLQYGCHIVRRDREPIYR